MQDMRFFGKHGVYPTEKKWTNQEFIVNVDLSYIYSDAEYLDYTLLYEAIKTVMDQAKETLEELCVLIQENLFKTFSVIQSVNISITKQVNIGGPLKSVMVSHLAQRN